MTGDDDPCVNTTLSLGREWELRKQQPAVDRYEDLLQEEVGLPAGGSRQLAREEEEEEEAVGNCRLRLGTSTDVDREEDSVHDGGGHAEGSGDGGGNRKKLRLSREQLLLLERSFRQLNTLTAFEKNEIAEKLDLLPRQVEVWFQNKRARTKLKQTEVDCDDLKKCCERLKHENQRLKEEMRELNRSARRGLLQHTQEAPAPAPAMYCPSCEQRLITAGNITGVCSFDNDVAAAGPGNDDRSRAAGSCDGFEIDLNG